MSGTAQNGAPYPTTTATGNAPNTLPDGADISYWNQWLGYNQLSRFKWDEATDSIDLSTEQVIIKVEAQRGQCCHVAGDMGWDDEGNLYLVTGDNTPAGTPGANGMAPNNNSPGQNPGHDARRGAGNSNDLRGKVLRITVAEDGSYTVPAGNLFPEAADTENQTRPEIFVMGLRNPFRMEVDPQTNSVSWGDYGPDAGAANPDRGPKGYVEWQSTSLDEPINGGWPYCTGEYFDYNNWDFATQTQGPWFDCEAGAISGSTWNTGLPQLPPATAPQLWYGDTDDEQPWPELTAFGPGGGQGPMGGPVYHYDEYPDSPSKFPAYWDNKAFFFEFSQDYVAALTVDWPDGEVSALENFLPNAELSRMGQPIWDNPMDLELGPDGSLYVLEYGDGFFRQNPDAGLYRVNYAPGDKSPQASFTATPNSSSAAPLTVTLDASASADPEGQALTYEWDFDGDGTYDATGVTATHTYTELGGYSVRLRVTDPGGRLGVSAQTVTVGNQAPTVTIDMPSDGGFFNWGDRIPFEISTTDPEDGEETTCSRVQWQVGLGHAAHAHPLTLGAGCTGSWVAPVDGPEHGDTENIYLVVVVNYTDAGNAGIPGATGSTTLTLNPMTQQAEHADQLNGVTVTADETAAAGSRITSLDAGDSLVWDPVDFANVDGVVTRASGEGTLSLRWGAADAEPFATIAVPAGAGWQDVTTPLANLPTGSGQLYVTSTGGVEVDQFEFQGTGVADVTGPVFTVTPDPATPTGTNNWYSASPVQVNLSTSDPSGVGNNNRQYRIVTNANQCGQADAEWSRLPNNGNITISNEGTNVICYRATDNAGNQTTGNYTVRIDTQAPTVNLPGVADDGMVTDSIYLVPSLSDPSPGSGGLVTTAITLDGEAWPLARPINLATLSLGEHTIVVSGRDSAGNTVEQTRTFTTVASFDGINALIDRYTTSGAIKSSTAAGLRDRLERAEDAAAAGNESRAMSYLDQFISRVNSQVSSTGVKGLLVRDARALIDGLED